jgi:hypothetical protein
MNAVCRIIIAMISLTLMPNVRGSNWILSVSRVPSLELHLIRTTCLSNVMFHIRNISAQQLKQKFSEHRTVENVRSFFSATKQSVLAP